MVNDREEEEEEIRHLEDSLVHDVDEEPKPEGLGIYLTPKFLARLVLVIYGAMAVVGGLAYIVLHGPLIPVLLIVALPFALVAGYLNVVTPPEPEIAKQRSVLGQVIAGIIVLILMLMIAIFLWWAAARAFTLS